MKDLFNGNSPALEIHVLLYSLLILQHSPVFHGTNCMELVFGDSCTMCRAILKLLAKVVNAQVHAHAYL